ncbi:MAG TPA: DUF423 domain-containing protein [Patescibacteria group bacterium]|nr:DUF423 domain-containing protein [Patescibacteria group bacterium]
MTAEKWRRGFIVVAGLSGALAVGMGAYAAHGLSGVPQELAEKASRFEIYHALALLAVAQMQGSGGRLAVVSGLLFTIGSLLFCGALYGMAVCGWAVGFVAPYGGSAFILGWLALAGAALAERRP